MSRMLKLGPFLTLYVFSSAMARIVEKVCMLAHRIQLKTEFLLYG
jgi:hypothetical protein